MVDNPPLVATYRLQLTPTFGLGRAAEIVSYLARLGVSHVYTSPFLQAAPSSTHGYDSVDHARVSDELGGEEALAAFHRALRTHGMGHVADVVPNHMSIADPQLNPRWWNVLRDGPQSDDARFFDIDWDAPGMAGKLLVPVLADDVDSAVDDGLITLEESNGEPVIGFGALRFPVAPASLDPNSRGAGDDLRALLDRQHYRLANWREATEHLSHRRFFDVTTLIGVRVEDPAVFAAVHERTLAWLAEGTVQGLRIDHPDGLRDPAQYLRDLRKAAPDAWIVVEKILEPGERLPANWPVDGTTGYDAMATITGVFVDSDAQDAMTRTWSDFVGEHLSYEDQVVAAKRQVLDELFRAEVDRVTRLAVTVGGFDSGVARTAVVALLVAMPVYRTYVTIDSAGEHGPVVERSAQDDAVIAVAIERAQEHDPDLDPRVLQRLGSLLRGTRGTGTERDEFVARFQQLSGPAMAKGVEDTVFYRATRLLALDEVGSDPGRFGITAEDFHREMAGAARHRPRSMVATSTHDAKRSEDVRARIALLTEIPDEWGATVARWAAMNEPAWAGSTRHRAIEFLLYQTLVGAPSLDPERVRTHLVKAMREAKQITSWLDPVERAEAEALAFAARIMRDDLFQDDLARFNRSLDPAARLAGIAQLTIKTMVPGVADFYQGSELFTDALVDPDNRRDIDWETRRLMLDEIDAQPTPPAGLAEPGLVKLWLTRRLLSIRRLVPAAFMGANATYRPLPLNGNQASRGIAFQRSDCLCVVVPVRPLTVTRSGWDDTSIELPDGHWIDALGGVTATSGRVWNGEPSLGKLSGEFGIAVLVEADRFDGVDA